jgi:hypothetical protein
MIRVQIGQESFQKRPSEGGCPHLPRGVSPPDFFLRPLDRPASILRGHFLSR